MKILIAYVTRYGHARAVARALAARLTERGLPAETADLEIQLRTPASYDAVVIGAATRFGHLPPSVFRWIELHEDRLRAIPVFAFTTSWRVHSTSRVARALRAHGMGARKIGAFGGRIANRRYSPLQRAAIAAGIALTGGPLAWLHPSRDIVLTKWSDVTAFADAIAGELVAPRPA